MITEAVEASIPVLALVNTFGGLIFGYSIGIITGATSNGDARILYPKLLDSFEVGLFGSSVLFGALISSLVAGVVAQKVGRKYTMMGAGILAIVFSIVPGLCQNFWEIFFARCFLGLAIGTIAVVCPMYVGEMAPTHRRGTLGTLFQLMICFGILFGYIVTAAIGSVHDSWRWIFIVGLVFGLGLFLVAFVAPESHVYLGQTVVSNEGNPLLGVDVELTFGEQLSRFLRSRAMWVGLALAVAQQLTGVNAFFFFASRIFQDAGIGNVGLAAIGLGAWNFITTLLATGLVDRMGRRPLILVGTAIMTLADFGLGIVFATMHDKSAVKGALSIILLLIFVAAFESSDGPLFWVVAAEMFTPDIKAVGSSIMTAFQWLFNILLALFFQVLVDAIGQSTVFFIFGAFGVGSTIVLFFFLPETSSRVTQVIQ